MSTTGFSRTTVDNESAIDWRPSRTQITILQLAVKTMLFLLVVGLLAFFVGSPNDRPNTTPADSSDLSPAVQSTDSGPVKVKRERAMCIIGPVGDSGVSGTLHLVKIGNNVEIRGEIRGLTPGKHGFHIHEFGDLSDAKTGRSAGGHFNPTNQPHGRQDARQRHVGDLGNIEAGNDGKAFVNVRDSVIRFDGANSIIGRSIVLHADADKFTQPAGDAGARIAFGVIGVAASE